MKLDRIRINKSPQQPEGVEIELAKPENPNEENLLAFLLTGYIRDLKHDGRLPYDLPDKFRVLRSKHLLLADVVYLIKAQSRLIDFAFRYGGEEYLVLRQQTSKDHAVVDSRRLQESLGAGTFCSEQGLNLRLRASMGLATFPTDAQTPH